MSLDVTDQIRQQCAPAYTRAIGRRDTHMGIDAGSPAFILDDPDGDPWVMAERRGGGGRRGEGGAG
jgi:hypothetical protein